MARNRNQGSTAGTGTTTQATAAALGIPGRVPDATDPTARERLRRLFERRRMQNGGRLSTILSDELRNRVT